MAAKLGASKEEQTPGIFPQGGILTGVYENTFISLHCNILMHGALMKKLKDLLKKNSLIIL
jgi:hypothetical protein